MKKNYNPILYNYDLAPTDKNHRNWTWVNFTTIWMGMIHNIVAWETAGSLINLGMSPFQAISAVVIANIVLIIGMYINGVVGGKYGIPFPVIIRASFGQKGAYVPVILRAFIAIFWFALQAYSGSAALNAILGLLIPNWQFLSKLNFLGMGLNVAISVALLWLLHMFVVSKGMKRIKIFELWAGPLVIVLGIILVFWSIKVSHGLGPLFDQHTQLSAKKFWTVYPVAVTGLVGVWATLILNISDFTRFAKSQKHQIIGQTIGLPFTAIAFAMMSIITTSGTIIAFGHAIWNPVTLLQKFNNPILLIFGAVALIIITLSVNIAGNVVSSGYDLVNLFPRKLTFTKAGNISILASLLFMPWLWFNNSNTIISIMDAVAGALGPVTGIMFADYYVIHHRHYNIDSFYMTPSDYSYKRGWNFNAIVAMILGTVVALSGLFIHELSALYAYSWFLGVASGFISYWIFTRLKIFSNI